MSVVCFCFYVIGNLCCLIGIRSLTSAIVCELSIALRLELDMICIRPDETCPRRHQLLPAKLIGRRTIISLRRIRAIDLELVRIERKRRDLAESIQTTVRIGRNFIISCVRAVQLDIRIVDPVVLGLPSDYSRSSATLYVRTLEHCAVARLERDHIAGDDAARCSDIKANRPRWNILRTVVDLRHLFERTRNILRLDLARRRKFES